MTGDGQLGSRASEATRSSARHARGPAGGPLGACRGRAARLLRTPRRRGNTVFTVVVVGWRCCSAPRSCALVLVLSNAPRRARHRGGARGAAGRTGDRVLPVAGPLRARAGAAAGDGLRLGGAGRDRRPRWCCSCSTRRCSAPPTSWSGAVVAPVTEEAAQGPVRRAAAVVAPPRDRRGPRRPRVRRPRRRRLRLHREHPLLRRRLHGRTRARAGRPRRRRPPCSSCAASSARSRTRCSPPSSGSASASRSSTRPGCWRFLAPLLGYVAAVTAHASWNALGLPRRRPGLRC